MKTFSNLDYIKKFFIVNFFLTFLEHIFLIQFAEIQSCPRARTSLKFFSLDKRFDFVASGSILGINYKGVSSYPTGYVKEEEMFSMDFE